MLAVSLDNIKLVEYLFRKGADTSLTDKDGATLLQYVFYASQEYRKTLLKMIVAKDKSLINKLNTNQVPPIYYALVNNENVLVLMLLDMGAKIDFEDMMGNNILHSAMSRNCLPLVQEFLSRDKTLLHKKNSAGRNPFHQALYDFPMFKYLNEKDEMMFIELSDYLFKEKVKLNEKDYNKKTILDIALSKPYFRLCVKLMKEGAHTNISSSLSFLKKYPLDSILKDAEQFKELLMKKLDGNPLVAMGQVNDLFVKIKNNDLRIPKDFAPKEGFSFFKEKTIDSTVYEKVISVLKDIYDTKLKEVIAIHCKKSDKKLKTKASFLDENLKFLIENQEISKKIDKPSVHSVEGEFYKIKW